MSKNVKCQKCKKNSYQIFKRQKWQKWQCTNVKIASKLSNL